MIEKPWGLLVFFLRNIGEGDLGLEFGTRSAAEIRGIVTQEKGQLTHLMVGWVHLLPPLQQSLIHL